MRKFLPLKQFSGARKSSEGVDYSAKDDSGRNSNVSQERKGSIEASDEHSLYSEFSCRNSFSRHIGRQHWCPTCSENAGTRCNTPPSCDENLSATEENDAVVDSSKRLLSLDGIRSSHLQEEYMQKLTKSRSRSSKVDSYPNGSEKKGWEESASKPLSTPISPLRSAGDSKSKSKGTSQLLSSIPKVPDTGRHRSSPISQSVCNGSIQSSCPSNEFVVRRKTSGLPPLDLQSGSIRLPRPVSNTSSGGPSIMLQPRSYSFSDASSFHDRCFDGAERSLVKSVNSEEDGTQKDVSSSASSGSSHFKYPSARAVAERLAKAIRSSSKSSSNSDKCSSSIAGGTLSSNFQPVNEAKFRAYEDRQANKQTKHSSPCPSSNTRRNRDLSECSEITSENVMPQISPNPRVGFDCIFESKNKKQQTTFLLQHENLSDVTSEKGSLREIHVDQCRGRESEKNINRQSWTTDKTDQCGQERQLLCKRLESFIRYFESSIEEVQDKARSAEERAVSFELGNMAVDDFILINDHLLSRKEDFKKATAAKILELQHKVRELQEEKSSLALEVAAELRQRIGERDSAKRVMTLMKTTVDLYIKASEKEQQEFTSGLERNLQTREVENMGLRERIGKLEEEKAGLQNDLTLVTSQENVLGEKVKNFELLMEGHKMRVEEAEKTIMHLRQASMYAQKQNKQADEELHALRKTIKEKEEENILLCKSLGRFQQLVMDQEKKNMQIACRCMKKSPCNGEESKNLNTTHENPCTMKCKLAMESKADNSCLRSENLALENGNYRLAKELTNALNNEKHSAIAFQTSDGRKLTIEDKTSPMSSGINLKGITALGKGIFKKGTAEGRKKGFHASSIPMEWQQCLKVNEDPEERRKDCMDPETGLEFLRKTCSLKEELEFLKEKYQALSQHEAVVQSENNLLQSLLNDMNTRVAQLEDKLREKEEHINLLQEVKEENTLESSRLRTELSSVRKERDDMQKEAEDLGREALRMSALVEVLRRKVNQLEDDVLLKEGQISILKGSYEACD